MKVHVIASGQLPPPINGFSIITEKMLALMSESYDVDINNISAGSRSRGVMYHAVRLAKTLRAVSSLFKAAHFRDKASYIACEGNIGLLYTIILIITSRLLKYRIYLHHHSFGYIDNEAILMKILIFFSGKKLVHIFLCEKMQKEFFATYDKLVDCVVIPNSAFVPPSAASELREHQIDKPLVIGLLSNLNREKGLYTFLNLLKEAKATKLPIKAILAGPLSTTEDESAVMELVKELGDIFEYRGPLGGREKDQFYLDVDCFVFPTEYVNEAQPTVLFEAQAAGNVIVSFDRGCISQQILQDGISIPQSGDFVSITLNYLSEVKKLAGADPNFKKSILARYEKKRESARNTVMELFLK